MRHWKAGRGEATAAGDQRTRAREVLRAESADPWSDRIRAETDSILRSAAVAREVRISGWDPVIERARCLNLAAWAASWDSASRNTTRFDTSPTSREWSTARYVAARSASSASSASALLWIASMLSPDPVSTVAAWRSTVTAPVLLEARAERARIVMLRRWAARASILARHPPERSTIFVGHDRDRASAVWRAASGSLTATAEALALIWWRDPTTPRSR